MKIDGRRSWVVVQHVYTRLIIPVPLAVSTVTSCGVVLHLKVAKNYRSTKYTVHTYFESHRQFCRSTDNLGWYWKFAFTSHLAPELDNTDWPHQSFRHEVRGDRPIFSWMRDSQALQANTFSARRSSCTVFFGALSWFTVECGQLVKFCWVQLIYLVERVGV